MNVLRRPNKYSVIIEALFKKHHRKGETNIRFKRSELVAIASDLKIEVPKNLGDILYSFRYRSKLPESILKLTPKGKEWIIRGTGQATYEFCLVDIIVLEPSPNLAITKILDATPGMVSSYSLTDEQALLAKLRYNRLVDIFIGCACYSLQNHLRTAVQGIGQVEVDELYVGIDSRGVQYVIPIQAKGGSDRLGIVQIEQDFEVCKEKFSPLVCRSVAAQFIDEKTIALFELTRTDEGIKVLRECHYRLVGKSELSHKELESYRFR